MFDRPDEHIAAGSDLAAAQRTCGQVARAHLCPARLEPPRRLGSLCAAELMRPFARQRQDRASRYCGVSPGSVARMDGRWLKVAYHAASLGAVSRQRSCG